ncbi:hypothetical protein OAS67_02675 [Alphaproteobacteria bacterium]|nr:hypothetical protein [Alphaproteobacteria bacterium]
MEATSANPIRRKGLNNVGPFIAKGALDRIGAYVASPSTFDGVCWREWCLSRVHAPFGDLTTAQWVHLSRIRCRTVGRSATVSVFLTRSGVLLKMRICGEIRIPAPLVLRGEASNFLLLETAMKMTVRGPKENLVVITGCGHAPALMAGRSGLNHPGLACY